MAHDLSVIAGGSPQSNLLWNPNHDYWTPAQSGLLQNTGGYTCDDVYVGPGTGANVNWSRVDNDASLPALGNYGQPVPYWLRLSWQNVAASGETQYLPNFRYTFLERYITAPNLSELIGRTVTMTAWLRANGINWIVPVTWYNLHNGDYKVIDGGGIAVTTSWQQFTINFTLPPADESAIDSSAYLGAGFDFVYPTSPILDVGPMSLIVG